MTVVNVLIEASRIRLVSDTVGYIGHEPVVLRRKISVARAAHVAFLVRGQVVLSNLLEKKSTSWGSFTNAMRQVSEQLATLGDEYFQEGRAEITLVGWQNGPRAARLVVSSDLGTPTVRQFDLEAGAYLAPALGNHQIPASMTDEQFAKVALLQQEIALRHKLSICVGGDVEMVTVDQFGIRVRKLCEYPDKAFTGARIREASDSVLRSVAA